MKAKTSWEEGGVLHLSLNLTSEVGGTSPREPKLNKVVLVMLPLRLRIEPGILSGAPKA